MWVFIVVERYFFIFFIVIFFVLSFKSTPKMFWNPDKYLYIDRSISTMNKKNPAKHHHHQDRKPSFFSLGIHNNNNLIYSSWEFFFSFRFAFHIEWHHFFSSYRKKTVVVRILQWELNNNETKKVRKKSSPLWGKKIVRKTSSLFISVEF